MASRIQGGQSAVDRAALEHEETLLHLTGELEALKASIDSFAASDPHDDAAELADLSRRAGLMLATLAEARRRREEFTDAPW